MEVWKDVIDFEGLYQISSRGKLKSCRKGIIMKLFIGKSGYHEVQLYKGGKRFKKTAHQLVAESFLDKDYVKRGLVADHKDNNPSNNNVSNLQLITQRKNCSKDKKSVSGLVGAKWDCRVQKWAGSIFIEKKHYHLGFFKDAQKAKNERDRALNEYYTHNRITRFLKNKKDIVFF